MTRTISPALFVAVRGFFVGFREHRRGQFPPVTRLVILCRTREEAEAALEIVRAWVETQGLRLHPDKTHVGDCRQAGEGFDFLGYRFEQGRRWVRKKSWGRIKDRIREKTGRSRGDSLARIVSDLNPTLKGWYGYFKHAHYTTFRKIDGFVRRRLRAVLRKQEKRPGMGRCLEDQKRWPNAYFAAVGLFALYPVGRRAFWHNFACVLAQSIRPSLPRPVTNF
ncbi:MAG: hypothetical protein EPN21_02630 [Methylococcaceae bacterium]|nr:MAG: hypothetical protein EPN21_02630 [Methylococcaceae bacterium]